MLEDLIGQKVVIDLQSEYVCLGTLIRVEEHILELKNADLHDLRDGDTTRENYVVAAASTGVSRNRKRLILFRRGVVGIAALADVVVD